MEEDGDYDTLSLANSSYTSITLNPTFSEEDRESLALLKQIFPDESISELRQLHHERLERRARDYETTTQQPSSPQRQYSQAKDLFPRVELPHDFLRLPTRVAVLRPVRTRTEETAVTTNSSKEDDQLFEYESLDVLERRVIRQLKLKGYHEHGNMAATIFTRAVSPSPEIGLGMTLSHEGGHVKVQYVADARGMRQDGKATTTLERSLEGGPAMQAGIQPGDTILGFNGICLVDYSTRTPSQRKSYKDGQEILKHVVEIIQNSPNPIVIHCKRILPNPPANPDFLAVGSLLDETLLETSADEIDLPDVGGENLPRIWSTPSFGQNGESQIHLLIQRLAAKGLVPSQEEEINLTATMALFHERAWEMESFSSLRLDRERSRSATAANNTSIPLMGVRRALSVRILNHFTAEAQSPNSSASTAYTIWVYDVESGREWYAPLRYFQDFADLRYAAVNLIPTLGKLAFPKPQRTGSIFGSPRPSSSTSLEAQCWQLEKFLRSLCSHLYDGALDIAMGELAIHVQSFLGCETSEYEDATYSVSLSQQVSDTLVENVKRRLKRSIQCYTYRSFLLKPLAYIVDDFVETMRQKCPTLQDLESIESQGVETLQQRALKDLATLEKFLDFLQSCILEGCLNDFRSITMHDTFAPLRSHFHGKRGEITWNALVRDAVREQVEVEAYVPLRSVVSRWLVNGWRHEDMEAHFKINELRKRPISFFNSMPNDSNPQSWLSPAKILKENVERSTLPCAKLKAIVAAAQEITRICADENSKRQTGTHTELQKPNEQLLGADQFLPILIYCVIMANIEHPCALCVLLRSLCDKISKIGEVGYYLASFEATVMHVRDFDLTEDSDQMRSFVSVNLDTD